MGGAMRRWIEGQRGPLARFSVAFAGLVVGLAGLELGGESFALAAPPDGSGSNELGRSVAVFHERGGAGLARKVRAELRYLGLSVLDPSAARTEGAQEFAGARPRATLQITSNRRVELYLAADGDDTAVLRVFESRPGEGDSFALRVAEDLRAHLVDPGLGADAVPTREAATATVSSEPSLVPRATLDGSGRERIRSELDGKAVSSAPLSLWLAAGPAGVLGIGGIGPLLQGSVAARFERNGLRWGLSALLPIRGEHLSAPEGEVQVYLSALRAEASYSHRLATDWRWMVGVGAGVVLLTLRTEAAPNFVGRDDRILTGTYYLHGGVAWSAAESVRFEAGLGIGLFGPRPVLRFDDRSVASFGPPFGALVLEAQIGWPVSGGSS
jgi:hypothetical protein